MQHIIKKESSDDSPNEEGIAKFAFADVHGTLKIVLTKFIFNPCITLQLICPCANFYFILFIYLFSLLAISLRLFLPSYSTLFLLILWFCVPLEMLEGFWFSHVSRGCEIIYRPINDDLVWLVVFQVYALWGYRRAFSFQVFSGDMELEQWPEMGRAKETNIYQQSM